MPLSIPAPAPDALDGDRLRAELTDRGVTRHEMTVLGDRLVFPDLGDSDRTTVEVAVTAHMQRPRRDPDGEFRKALEAATTVAQIRDALLGKTGPGAQPRNAR